MSDQHSPSGIHQEGEGTVEPAAPAPGEEYDLPLDAAPRPRAAAPRPWPGWVRAFLFLTVVMMLSGLAALLSVPLALLLIGSRVPASGAALEQALIRHPLPIFASSLLALLNALLVTYLVMRWWERRALSDVGLSLDARSGRQFAGGIALGAGLITGIFGVEAALGWLRVSGAMPLLPALGHVLIWFLALLPAAAFEEVVLRGYTFRALEQQWGATAATVITALLFSLLHGANPSAGIPAFLGIVASGIMFGVAFLATRRLWLPIGLHVAWNLFEGPVYGFPVSGIPLPGVFTTHVAGPALWTGGGFGPEAGLLALLATLAGMALLLLGYRRRLNTEDTETRRGHGGDTDVIGQD